MKTELLITGISQLVTAEGAAARHGARMGELKVVKDAALAISGERIDWVGASRDWTGEAAATLDLEGSQCCLD